MRSASSRSPPASDAQPLNGPSTSLSVQSAPAGVLILQKLLTLGAIRLFRIPPYFARACGRVSVGGHPDKRPDSRPEREFRGRSQDPTPNSPAAPKHLTGSRRRNRLSPALGGGRGLKQRRSGFSGPPASIPGACHRRGLFIIAGSAVRGPPKPTQGRVSGSRACVRLRVPNARRRSG